MILQAVDFIQTIADIVAAILTFLYPIVSPMGLWMVNWMDYVLQFFPQNNLSIYITIFIVIITIGAMVNIAWPGNKKPGFLKKADEVEEKIERKVEERVEEIDAKIKKKKKKEKVKTKKLEEKSKEIEGDAEELERETDTLEEEIEELEEDIKDVEEELEETTDEE